MAWKVLEAWSVVTQVTAPAFAVTAEAIGAPSRGRGPRPPREIWDAKKMAVHLAVKVADCAYADLGRAIGLHRDTVASHCAAMREACADDGKLEALADALEEETRLRLRLGQFEALTASRARAAALAAAIADQMAENGFPTTHPTVSGTFIRQPDPLDEKKIISLKARRSA